MCIGVPGKIVELEEEWAVVDLGGLKRKVGTQLAEDLELGDYVLMVSHDYTWGWSAGSGESGRWPRAGGIIISTGPDKFIISGTGIIVTFGSSSPDEWIVGIAHIQEGEYADGQWVPGRWMNGDQSHQGRHLRIPAGSFGIQHITLYRYE